MVTEDDKEVEEKRDGEAVKGVDGKELHERSHRACCLRETMWG
jgi:hypothetical protein